MKENLLKATIIKTLYCMILPLLYVIITNKLSNSPTIIDRHEIFNLFKFGLLFGCTLYYIDLKKKSSK